MIPRWNLGLVARASLTGLLVAGCASTSDVFPYGHPDVERSLTRRVSETRIEQRRELFRKLEDLEARGAWLERQLWVEGMPVLAEGKTLLVLARLAPVRPGATAAFTIVAAPGPDPGTSAEADAALTVLELASTWATAMRAQELPRAPFALYFAALRESTASAAGFGPIAEADRGMIVVAIDASLPSGGLALSRRADTASAELAEVVRATAENAAFATPGELVPHAGEPASIGATARSLMQASTGGVVVLSHAPDATARAARVILAALLELAARE